MLYLNMTMSNVCHSIGDAVFKMTISKEWHSIGDVVFKYDNK